MPRLDKTGPTGQGPLTGRKGGNPPPRLGQRFGMGRGFGPCCLGLGWGRGFGIGRRNWVQTREEQAKAIADYKEALKRELEEVEEEEENMGKGE